MKQIAPESIEQAIDLVQKEEDMKFLISVLEGFQINESKEAANSLWKTARELPHRVAHYTGDFVVQMIA